MMINKFNQYSALAKLIEKKICHGQIKNSCFYHESRWILILLAGFLANLHLLFAFPSDNYDSGM